MHYEYSDNWCNRGNGHRIVNQSVALGYNVTAFVRNKSKFKIKNKKINIVTGDILEKELIEYAIRGQDAVLCALGHKKWLRPTKILSVGTKNIVEAMEKNNVRRLICETSLGVGNSYFRMGLYYSLFTIPVILQFYYWDKYRQEKIIKSSNTDWTIVRPGLLTKGKARGKYKEGTKIGNWIWTVRISRKDVANFMLKQIQMDKYICRTVEISW